MVTVLSVLSTAIAQSASYSKQVCNESPAKSSYAPHDSPQINHHDLPVIALSNMKLSKDMSCAILDSATNNRALIPSEHANETLSRANKQYVETQACSVPS